MRALRAALVASAVAAALVAVGVAPARTSPASHMATKPSLATNLLAEVNRLRAAHGLVPLRESRELDAAAGQHSFEMAVEGYFAHGAYARRLASYYPASRYRFWMVGENLVWGSPTLSAHEALQSWLRSPEHRANLFRRVWREAGVSAVHAAAAPGAFQGLAVTVVTFDYGRRD